MAELSIPELPRSVYSWKEAATPEQAVSYETQMIFAVHKIEFPKEGGILIHHIGTKYPAKGWPNPTDVSLNNTFKRIILLNAMLFANKWMVLVLWPFVLLPYFIKIRIIETYLMGLNRLAYQFLLPRYYEPRYYSVQSQELKKLLTNFLTNLGISKDPSENTAQAIAHLFEHDSAYHNRLGDIFGASSQALMQDPRKEIMRLAGVFAERESRTELIKRFRAICEATTWLFVLPRFKKAFVKAINSINFKNLQADKASIYRTLTDGDKSEGGYNWGGRTKEDRTKEHEALHKANVIVGGKVAQTVGWYPPYKIVKNLVFK